MFASRSFTLQSSGRNTLDVPVASLAGLSVAFLAFAAPADLLAELVGASGLPSIIAAAEPPLGFKARLGLGAAGAVAVFALAFLVLRWLDRFGRRRAEEAEEEIAAVETPRLRRRDFHPDAPARPPLLAVHELGEPELELNDLDPALPAHREAEPWATSPESEGFMDGRAFDAADDQQAHAETPVENPWTETSPTEAEEELRQEPWADEAEPESEVERPAPESWADPEPPAGEVREPPAASATPWPEAADDTSMTAAPAEPAEPSPGEIEAANAGPAPAQGSIAELMARLEQGIARRRSAPAPAEPAVAAITQAPAPVPDAQVPAGPSDDRLQNAIDSLQRFAARQD